jgi:hypothetical protein
MDKGLNVTVHEYITVRVFIAYAMTNSTAKHSFKNSRKNVEEMRIKKKINVGRNKEKL